MNFQLLTDYQIFKSWLSFGSHYYLVAAFAVIFVAVFLSRYFAPLWNFLDRRSAPFFESRVKAPLVLFLFSFGLYAAVSIFFVFPRPTVHDEFCYLLTADTFLHGHLSVESHPLWKHFETFYIIQNPFYVAKYPPAQGAILAFGRMLTGFPAFGVWLSCALAVVGVYWFLAALFPRKWAFFGAALMAVHPILFNWSQIYWGGAAALAGGALVLGGFCRLLQNKSSLFSSVLFGLGAALLANSRPYEGFLLVFITGCILLFWTIQNRSDFKSILAKFYLPVFIILLVNFGWMAVYNKNTTGSALQMPYTAHHSQYHTFPLFLFQKLQPPREIPYQDMREYEEMSIGDYQRQVTSPGALIKSLSIRWVIICAVFFTATILYLLPFFAGLWESRRERIWRILLICFSFMMVGFSLSTYSIAHYTAPALSLAMAFVVKGLQYFWRLKINTNYLKTLVLLIPAANLLGIFLLSAKLSRSLENDMGYQRYLLTERLKSGGGRQLVIVDKESQSVSDTRFYIYNDAFIDDSPVVWARDIGESENRELMEYFKDRNVWRLSNVGNTAKLDLIRKAEK